jgi:hypothetical protein
MEKKYQMPKECMGFVINYRDVDYCGNPRFLTQEFERDGDVYQISIVVDYHFEMHAYRASEFEGLSVPIEVATLKNGEYWDETDIEWRAIACDMELGEFLHEWLKFVYQTLEEC